MTSPEAKFLFPFRGFLGLWAFDWDLALGLSIYICVHQSVWMCTVECTVFTVVLVCVQPHRDQTGTKEGRNREKFSFKMDRQSLQSAIMGKLSWAGCHQLSIASCHEHKKAEKGDQLCIKKFSFNHR